MLRFVLFCFRKYWWSSQCCAWMDGVISTSAAGEHHGAECPVCTNKSTRCTPLSLFLDHLRAFCVLSMEGNQIPPLAWHHLSYCAPVVEKTFCNMCFIRIIWIISSINKRIRELLLICSSVIIRGCVTVESHTVQLGNVTQSWTMDYISIVDYWHCHHLCIILSGEFTVALFIILCHC